MNASWDEKIFNYGYLVTNAPEVKLPSWGSRWNEINVNGLSVCTHPLQKTTVHHSEEAIFLLIGHAYNPFTLEKDEQAVLRSLATRYNEREKFLDYLDQITGVFTCFVVTGSVISVFTDCSGMMGAYYAKEGQLVFCSSHAQLLAELCGFKTDPYVDKLKSYRFFKLYGRYLPGNLSPYGQVKRVIPNVELVISDEIQQKRFYPRKQYDVCHDEDYYRQVQSIAHILNNSLQLILEKWKNPAISLTGGMDSKTTLACAKPEQGEFSYFSYISLPREATDAYAAQELCNRLGLKHTIYEINTDVAEYEEFSHADEIIERHYGYLGKGNSNDVCKRLFLSDIHDFDIEVKSWVSEIARASRYKQYARKQFSSKPTARQLTTMYKIFLWNRRTALQTDKVFRKYLCDSGLTEALEAYEYPWTEFFVWEIIFGGWGGLVLTGEHKTSGDITIPYNNRALLDMMIRTPLDKRITDQLHRDIMNVADDRIDKMGICVINGNQTRLRAYCEKLYYEVHSRWPL